MGTANNALSQDLDKADHALCGGLLACCMIDLSPRGEVEEFCANLAEASCDLGVCGSQIQNGQHGK